jgi:HlyD family secretion protein
MVFSKSMEECEMRWKVSLFTVIIGCLIASCGGNDIAPGGSGFIEATQIVVSAETGGQIKSLNVDEGDQITKGDTIGQIDTVSTVLLLRQAEALRKLAESKIRSSSLNIEQASYNLNLATKEYERISALLESGAIDQQQYDRVENDYKQVGLTKKQAEAFYQAAQAELAKAESEIALLKEQLSDCFPISPGSGVITSKFVEVGELVGTGKPLVKVAKLDTVWVKVYLPPEDLTQISLGGRAQVDPEDGRTEPLDGRVSWISDEAEFTPKNVQTKEARADLVYAVKITIPNPEGILKIGMPVLVEIR